MTRFDESSQHDENEILAACERGVVQRCVCCGALRLAFGNAVLNLHPDDLAMVRGAVRAAVAARATRAVGAASDVRSELRLGDSGGAFSFDRRELLELDVLITSAARELRRPARVAEGRWSMSASTHPIARFPHDRR